MATEHKRKRILIMGAAGRDFHNFNVAFRDDPATEVVAFTAAQIPGIAERRYPQSLAGNLYAGGIPIVDEADLEDICRRERVEQVVFAYSDVTHAVVMHAASRCLSSGTDFLLLGPDRTMLAARKPVVAVSAVRTGCGKSQTSRWLVRFFTDKGLKVAAIRHPMPYGDLPRQAVQRFASRQDLNAADCTIEEREEYEPYIAIGGVVFAGVDYSAILREAEREADIIVWDGGNNDFPFVRPDLHIVIADALRPGHASAYHPGEAVLRMADIVVINKVDSATEENLTRVTDEVRELAPSRPIVRAASPVSLDNSEAVRGRKVLVVEDGPTITHGGMAHGAGYVAVAALGGVEIVDPKPYASPLIAKVYASYPHIGAVLPAVGYGQEQLRALEDTINSVDADLVVVATPADLGALLTLNKPIVRARYEYADAGEPTLGHLVDRFLEERAVL